MPIEYKNNLAIFSDVVSAEDAEGLFEWLQNQPAANIDLEGCSHLHPTSLQVLIAAKNHIACWPTVFFGLADYSGKTLMGDGSILMVRNVKEVA